VHAAAPEVVATPAVAITTTVTAPAPVTAPIAGAVFVDPIVVMLEMPDVAHSFLYRAPRSAFEWLCFLWCASEPGMQLYFRRRFSWYQHIVQHSYSLFNTKFNTTILSE